MRPWRNKECSGCHPPFQEASGSGGSTASLGVRGWGCSHPRHILKAQPRRREGSHAAPYYKRETEAKKGMGDPGSQGKRARSAVDHLLWVCQRPASRELPESRARAAQEAGTADADPLRLTGETRQDSRTFRVREVVINCELLPGEALGAHSYMLTSTGILPTATTPHLTTQ